MRKMRAKALCMLIVLASATSSYGQGLLEAAREADWTVQNISRLKQLFPDTSAVNAFVRQLYGADAVQPNVGEYALVDLRHDGNIQLVVTIDFSGRGFYTTVYIVSKSGDKLRTHELNTDGADVTDLASRIVDLHHDGTKQIILPRRLGPYEGVSPVPIVPDVHKWDGQRLVKANSEFKDYYATVVLPRLKTALAELSQKRLSSGATNNANPKDKRCDETEAKNTKKLRDKYSREIDEVNKIVDQ